MIKGFAVFRMDPKIGPQYVYQSDTIETVTHQEVLAIFATHNLFREGFRGVHVSNRTWATYVFPPWIIALLLGPDEPIGPLREPMKKILNASSLPDEPKPEEWKNLYHDLLVEIQSSPVADLLTSKKTTDFLKEMIELDILYFDPHFSFEIGATYPAADHLTGLNSYDTRLFLEKLTLAGIFTSEPVIGVTHCPICLGFKVVSRLACPQCSVTALDVVRYPTSKEGGSQKANTSGKPMELFYSCLTCQHTTSEPVVTLLCTECGSQFQPDEAAYRNMDRLVLNQPIAEGLIKKVEEETSD
ncbi:hypothetical protein E2P64_07660 [Candidatus Bathyarchaeota archaeon]|nr:hypothetical protein E2P64_07660 [Candidatus Bathyarchaeota archaeon]